MLIKDFKYLKPFSSPTEEQLKAAQDFIIDWMHSNFPKYEFDLSYDQYETPSDWSIYIVVKNIPEGGFGKVFDDVYSIFEKFTSKFPQFFVSLQ